MKMIQKITGLALILTLVLGVFSACSSKNEPVKETNESLTPIRLVLDWTPNTNHTGIYVAEKLGYFRDAGLDVEIMQPPESGAVPLTAAGNAEFAISFQEEMGPAIAKDEPLPITAVAAIVSHNTSGIISLKEDAITSPKDLEGKNFAAWESPLVDGIMNELLLADGGDFGNVNFIKDSVTDAASALQANVDAVWVFYAWDGIATELAGLETNYFDFISYVPTFDYYTPVLVANDTFLEEQPDTAKAFLAAVSKGYDYTIENPKEAGEILLETNPEISEELVHQSLDYLAENFQADAPRWGEIDPERWSTFYDWMYEERLLDNPLGETGFTNEFLPE